MKLRALLALWLGLGAAQAAPRTSADYEIPVEALGDGGRAMSADGVYVNDGNFSGIVGIAMPLDGDIILRSGYAGQLYEVQSFAVSAPANPPTVVGGATVQLTGSAALDDGTLLTPPLGDIAWSNTGAGLTGVSTTGLATAAAVSTPASATVQAVFAGLPAMLDISVLVATPALKASVAGASLTAPDALPGLGSLKVTLLDANGVVYGAGGPRWRLVDDPIWRASQEVIPNLVAGSYPIEFEHALASAAVPPFLPAPAPAVVTVLNGPTTARTFRYPKASATGTLDVSIFPSAVAGNAVPEQRGRWRLTGETAWRDSNALLAGLPSGNYVLEFTAVQNYLPIPTQNITVETNALAIVTYQPTEAVAGALPQALGLETSTTQAPYNFVGQLTSSVGMGSGTVVADRVVLTAAHAIFDDDTLTFATDLQWRFRRSAGQLEPAPLAPRGAYLLDGYAAARRAVSPGAVNVTSEERDTGVLYFSTDAGDGGSSGYLVSNSAREWLLEPRPKTLVGYPSDTSHVEDAVIPGRMQATAVQAVPFTKGSALDPDVYSTRTIAGLAGMSGGPLCVQADDGQFYPAGVYLGGAGECLVRGITATVQGLIRTADKASQGGPNHVGGGAIKVSFDGTGSGSLGFGSLTVRLGPGPAEGGWRLNTERSSTRHTNEDPTVVASSGTVIFIPVLGYLTPPSYSFQLRSGEARSIDASYISLRPRITTGSLKIAGVGQPYVEKIAATNAPTEFIATLIDPEGTRTDLSDHPLGLVLDNNGNLMSPMIPDAIPPLAAPALYQLEVVASRRLSTLTLRGTRTLDLVIAPTRTVSLTYDAARGDVFLGKTKLPPAPQIGPLPEGTVVSLRAAPKSLAYLFGGWSGSGADGVPTLGTVLQFTVGADPVDLAALFRENVFFFRAGRYQGLLHADSDSLNARGLLTVQITTTGACTVSFLAGARSFSFKDAFKEVDYDAQRTTLFHTIPGRRGTSGVPVTLRLNTDSSAPVLDGTVTLDGVPFTFSAPRSVTKATAAKFLVALPHVTGSGLPQGDGYGTARLSAQGLLRFSGVLGDGTSIIESANLGPGGEWPFYALLYGRTNRGGLTGRLTIDGSGAVSGNLEWYKPPDRASFYPDGFTISVTQGDAMAVSGVPLSTAALSTFASSRLTVSIADGGLTQLPLPFQITFDAQGTAKVDPATGPAPDLFALKLGLTTGLYTGRFRDSDAHLHSFSGVALPALGPAAQEGFGVFKGVPSTKQTGAIELR